MFRKSGKNRRVRTRRNLGVVRTVLECLEVRSLLSGVTFSVVGTTLTVEGDATDNLITVQDNGTTVEIDDDGTIIDTGEALGSLSFIRLFGRDGNDTLTMDVSLGSIVKGFIYGGLGDDILVGGDGDDTLSGENGADSLSGGGGRDSLNFDALDAALDGGTGIDTASAVDPSAFGVTLVLNSVGNNLERVRGGAGNDTLDASAVLGGLRVDLTGLGGDDILTGGSGNDSISGGDGDDTIDGGDGDDNITGGAGNNNLSGGAGSDVLNYSGASSGVSVDLSAGLVSDNGEGEGGTDTVSGFEQVFGSPSDDQLVGSGADEFLKGNGGDDILIGLGGADQLDGGTGTDTADYTASLGFVNVTLSAGGAESGGDAEGDVLFAVENIIGSSFNDTIIGNSKDNMIDGGDGDDFLRGGSGNDYILGGLGNDTIYGNAGTDSLDGGDGNDTLIADSDDDQAAVFTGGGGTDSLRAESDVIPLDWVFSDLTLIENIFGSNAADIIDGSAVTNTALTISARNGNDTVWGGALGDTIFGGNNDDTIYGMAGADTIRGDAGSDSLFGNNFNNDDDNARDRFFGGTGTDTAVGYNLGQLIPALRDTIDTIENDLRV